ncbi:2051_t:CDS:10 [Diversispora eburnea]|uniref:2051_t:CDS:1 n=1 Tax=Diversispora eburnea TaxID=1213867 RepID=A0A9N8Z4T6_9GLOM|nr:2051_t:CDS:10 [Diversispora eburnea]
MSTKMNNNKIKYLLEALEQKKGEISMPKNQLQLLLSDIEAVGSKWKDANRVGQAQLYEAAEFVLNTLRGYTPYCDPFQKKVVQKEAPDYYKIIEHPMDFTQIAKKLKMHEYNNKQEFADDLYLIYSNCLKYNSNPDHIFREYARAMKEKTDELLVNVRDITIKSREEFLASVDQEQEDEQKINPSITENQPVTENQQIADSLVLNDEAQEENPQDLDDINVPVPEEEQIVNDSIIINESDDDEEEAEIDRELQEILSNFDMPKYPDRWDPEINNPDRDKFFEPGYDPSANNSTLDQYPQLQFPKRGTALMIENNIQTLKRSRILHSKLMAARQNIPLSHLGITETAPEEQITNTKPNIDPRNLPPLMLNSEGAFESTKRVVAKLCQHAGFEATSHTALTILTEVAQDYFLNLGKTLRTYIDDYGKKMTPEEIVTHTLYENGVTSINKIESYVKNDIIRYGSKLRDIHNRLETTYKEALASPENHETEEESFPDTEDAFMMGNFGEDLGDDFFGFRELGLGSLVVSIFPCNFIPQRLFLGTNKPKPQIKKTNEETRKNSQIGLLRDFFRNNMEESGGKLIEDEFLPVKQRNQRPKVPPTGKIPPQSKRLLKPQLTAAALAEKKRKRERDAQIAEEKERAKRLKAEERAKKQAEKEEAKRLKQLEREAQKKAEMEAKEARKAEQELQKRLAQEAKEARKAEAEAAKKAAMENKKRKTSTKTGKSKTPQAEISSTPVSRKHEPDDGSDSEMVPLAQRKKRRAESSGRTAIVYSENYTSYDGL